MEKVLMSFVVVTLKNTQAKAETKVQTAQLYCQALCVEPIMSYTQILVLVYIYALFLFNVKKLAFYFKFRLRVLSTVFPFKDTHINLITGSNLPLGLSGKKGSKYFKR